MTTSAGFATAGTYNEESLHAGDTHGAWRNPQVVPQYRPLFVTPGLDEGDVDAKLRARVRDFAWDHPGYVAEASGWNLLRMFEISGGSVVDARGREVNQRGIGSAVPASERAGLAVAAVLGIVGLLAILRSGLEGASGRRAGPPPPSRSALPLAGPRPDDPHRRADRRPAPLPAARLDPFLLILAAIGLVWLCDRRRRSGGDA